MRTIFLFLAFLFAFAQSNATQVTVQTSPAGRSFTVDGTTYTAAQVFNWTPGASHTIAVTDLQTEGSDTRYVWKSWSDSGTISHSVSPSVDITYTANFGTQYYLSIWANGRASVSPSSGWYAKDTVIAINTFQNGPGIYFIEWIGTGAGSYSGPNRPASITLLGPKPKLRAGAVAK